MTQTRRSFLQAAGAAALVGPTAVQAAVPKPNVVVELFTSQGCNSCPPAEAFLADLADRQGVLALEFHVDYWDYIGWKDPFADPAFTERQRRYNQLFGSPYNYTPQMVIDGRVHEVGSRRDAVEARIEAAAMKRAMAVQDAMLPSLTVDRAPGGLALSLDGVTEPGARYNIVMVGFDNRHVTQVTRGENRGKDLENKHVVRSLHTAPTQWTGGPLSLEIPSKKLGGDKGCAVLIQNPQTGVIAVAAKLAYS